MRHNGIRMFSTCIRYTYTHESVSIHNNIATIGFSPYMSNKLRPIVFTEPYIHVGDKVNRDQVVLRVETPQFYTEMIMPCGGQIIAYNPYYYYNFYSLRRPRKLNDKWVLQVALDHTFHQTGLLMSLVEYTTYVNSLP